MATPQLFSSASLATTAVSTNWRVRARQLVVLFKLRVVSLLLLAAVGGAFLGAAGWPGLGNLALLLLTGGMAAAGASALNQLHERHSDGRMRRTRERPLVTGDIAPRTALLSGVLLIVAAVALAAISNPALAFFLLLGAVIYVGVYTLWLKPRTILNIVIGGAAGSAAVLSGGAAAGAWQDPAVVVLALLVFLWTPAHFWSLALLYREDYRRIATPMLPTRVGRRAAAFWVAVHTLPTAAAALLLALAPALGWLYFLPVAIATGDLCYRNARLLRQPTPRNARRLFLASNLYLMVVLLAVCAATLL